MEVKEELNATSTLCCTCGSHEMGSPINIIDNFVKYRDSFVPFAQVIFQTLNFEVNFDSKIIIIGVIQLAISFRSARRSARWRCVTSVKSISSSFIASR